MLCADLREIDLSYGDENLYECFMRRHVGDRMEEGVGAEIWWICESLRQVRVIFCFGFFCLVGFWMWGSGFCAGFLVGWFVGVAWVSFDG